MVTAFHNEEIGTENTTTTEYTHFIENDFFSMHGPIQK